MVNGQPEICSLVKGHLARVPETAVMSSGEVFLLLRCAPPGFAPDGKNFVPSIKKFRSIPTRWIDTSLITLSGNIVTSVTCATVVRMQRGRKEK